MVCVYILFLNFYDLFSCFSLHFLYEKVFFVQLDISFTLFCSLSFILPSTSLLLLLPLFSCSAPCPLPSFLPTVNCDTGVVSVAWNNSVAGVVYMVSAVDKTGQRHNCTATNDGCNLSMLECGTVYNVTITPSRNGCVGRDSPTKVITTGKDQWHFGFT